MEIETFVHKAAIPLIGQESINIFSDNLSRAVRDDLKMTLGLTKNDSCWAAEIFGDSVIVSTYKSYVTGDNYSSSSAYYKVSYDRDKKTGDFTFGTPVEVRQVYQPVKPSIGGLFAVSKNNGAPRLSTADEDFELVRKSAWETVSIFKGIL